MKKNAKVIVAASILAVFAVGAAMAQNRGNFNSGRGSYAVPQRGAQTYQRQGNPQTPGGSSQYYNQGAGRGQGVYSGRGLYSGQLSSSLPSTEQELKTMLAENRKQAAMVRTEQEKLEQAYARKSISTTDYLNQRNKLKTQERDLDRQEQAIDRQLTIVNELCTTVTN